LANRLNPCRPVNTTRHRLPACPPGPPVSHHAPLPQSFSMCVPCSSPRRPAGAIPGQATMLVSVRPSLATYPHCDAPGPSVEAEWPLPPEPRLPLLRSSVEWPSAPVPHAPRSIPTQKSYLDQAWSCRPTDTCLTCHTPPSVVAPAIVPASHRR
jgi:hypothetical protein